MVPVWVLNSSGGKELKPQKTIFRGIVVSLVRSLVNEKEKSFFEVFQALRDLGIISSDTFIWKNLGLTTF